MAGESDKQLDRAVGMGSTQVMEDARADGIAAGRMVTTRAGSGRPVAAASFDTRLGQVFDTSDTLGDIRDIITWTNDGCSPDARGV